MYFAEVVFLFISAAVLNSEAISDASLRESLGKANSFNWYCKWRSYLKLSTTSLPCFFNSPPQKAPKAPIGCAELNWGADFWSEWGRLLRSGKQPCFGPTKELDPMISSMNPLKYLPKESKDSLGPLGKGSTPQNAVKKSSSPIGHGTAIGF
ncbi:hypothetical protein QR680_005409 [Steinernema hermaphroditum]|uniref:Uncharacterized protein n=1 Tax=Steinernema hermaphroditum TaxID=289476 RepID=A0AA39LVA3_9BILA|nr:hypothetical protein QR680_005409 [Steinernema hermaphroditum]